jgi:hypothetical protein
MLLLCFAEVRGCIHVPVVFMRMLCHAVPCCAQVLRSPVSRDMLGRVFNGSGKPIDNG